jgi:hypothetical protein
LEKKKVLRLAARAYSAPDFCLKRPLTGLRRDREAERRAAI